MFNLITGALPLNQGKIAFCGQDISRRAQRQIAARGIARTFQHVKLRPTMTLLDNVAARRLPAHAVPASSPARCGSTAPRRRGCGPRRCGSSQRVGLADRAFELAGNLPLGNQRLVEIARALAADPALLVLDEPAAGLRYARKEELARAAAHAAGRRA